MMADQKIDVEEILQTAGRDPLWALRGHAVQSYANFEQALAHLFSHLTGMPIDIAGIVFFKIVNTRLRNSILNSLVERKYGDAHGRFWMPFLEDVAAIDARRDEILHWNIVITMRAEVDENPSLSAELMPPNYWSEGRKFSVVGRAGLIRFIDECDVYARACNMFTALLSGRLPPDRALLWREVFQKPIHYPLPAGHPLSRHLPAAGVECQPTAA